MRSRITCHAKTHWRLGLATIVLWSAPVSLWSQGTSLLQQAHSIGEQTFSEIDGSVNTVADALLVSAAQTLVASNGRAGTHKTPSAGLAILYGPQLQRRNGNPSFATARVDLLRPAVEPILRSHGVPTDLVAVILVESGGRSDSLSPKGARGLWQLMPDTARRYGLRVDDVQDDRVDLFKATDAAARYLHDLHAQFGDWKLALAAYNTGEANVGSAILRAHTQSFDQLTNLRMLSLETRNYVPAVMAAIRSSGSVSVLDENRQMPIQNITFAVSSK